MGLVGCKELDCVIFYIRMSSSYLIFDWRDDIISVFSLVRGTRMRGI
jgi:hypothetical protein